MRRFTETTLLCALVAALYLSGCQKIETPQARRPAQPDSCYTDMATGLVRWYDSKTMIEMPPPNDAPRIATAARVEKAMAAADITVADVATFLFSRGWNIVPANLDKPHWRPVNWAPTDRPAYYVAEIKVAVADTSLSIYLPQAIGPYSVAVTAYRGNGTHSDQSFVGYRDNGDGSTALPGVRP